MLSLANVLLVALGGAVGSVCRYLLNVGATRALGPGFPYGTLGANAIGGLLMGVLVGVLALRGGADQEKWRLLVGVGVLGGFTTFSSFSLETALMIERRHLEIAAFYVLTSVAAALGGLFLGLFLMRRILA
ncbi:fluoride efflux transporter CrcB [Phenylobacterium sp.]|uniref:fluoride efflux transporter CrcB n=1 Tax=Phenylobacterium sp. TaxID=1871053 RepID=UPI0035624C44